VRRRLVAAAVLMAAVVGSVPAAAAQTAAVRAVLFFSPTCGHCQYVINDWLLPVWFPQYGGEPEWRYDESLGEEAAFYLATNGTLEILLVNRDIELGREFYDASAEVLAIPQERRGVPRLVVGDRYLVGSAEIPEEFPGIIEEGLASGGVDWPDIPGLQEALASIPGAPVTTTTIPGTTTTGAGTTTTTGGVLPDGGDSPWDRFRQDTVANWLALAVLVLMALSLVGVALLARRGDEAGPPGIAVPLLALAGLAVAIYLAFVETSGSQAVCGPVGDCNTVQQSEWARVFGVIPVGLIGVGGYLVVLACWVVARFGAGHLADWARVALFAGVVGGTGFSIYLTFLEPFVIGATCLWCLSSAAIITVLMWLTVRPASAAWTRLRAGN